MDNIITENIKTAPKNKRNLLKILREVKESDYPVGIYGNRNELEAGIKFYDGLIKRKEIEQNDLCNE